MARTRKKPEQNGVNNVPAKVEGATPIAPAAPPVEAPPPAPRKRPTRRTAAVLTPAPPPLGEGLGEAAGRAEALVNQLREAGAQLEQMVRDARSQVEALRAEREELRRDPGTLHEQEQAARQEAVQETRAQAEALRTERGELARDLESLREESRAVRQAVLQETRAAVERLCEAVAGAKGEVTRARRMFAEAEADLEGEVGRVRQELEEAGQALGSLPARAEEVRQKLEESQAQLRGFEESGTSTRQELRSLEEAVEKARPRLDALRREIAEAEARRGAAAREAAEVESRLTAARQQLEEVSREAARRAEQERQAAVAAEARFGAGKDRLGVTVASGVVVAEVSTDSPAAASGLAPGDVVTSVNGTPVHTGPELRDLIQHKAADEEINLRVTRGGLAAVVPARLTAAPEAGDGSEGKNRLGLTVDPGVVVAEVLPGSPAAASGLVRGDVLTGVNGRKVQRGEDLRDAIEPLEPGAEVSVQFRRAGEPREVKARLDVPASEGAMPGLA
jgi:uncharacterized coiled-coil DUF342 family protein